MAYGQNIVECPVVVFAGGGASAHLGFPVGGCFRKQLRDAVGEYAVGKYAVSECFIDKPPSHSHDQPLSDLWDAVCPQDERDPNFEAIFEALDAVANAPKVTREGSLAVGAGHLWDRCCEELVKAYGPPQKSKDITALAERSAHTWGRLVVAVHPPGENVLPLFTTNYDIALDQAAFKLGDNSEVRLELPFDLRALARPWRARCLDDLRAEKGCPTAALLHLHGCVSWQRPEDDTPGEVAYLAVDPKGRPIAATADMALVWPTPNKRPFSDPFWTHHWYLERCLENAKCALFIGYGFWDEAVWAILRRAVAVNQELMLLIWDTKREVKDRLVEAIPEIEHRLLEPITDPFNAESIEEKAELLGGLARGNSPGPSRPVGQLGAGDLEPTGTPHKWQLTDGVWQVTLAKYAPQDVPDWGFCLSKGCVEGRVELEAAVQYQKQPDHWAGIVFGWQDISDHWVLMKQDDKVRLKHVRRDRDWDTPLGAELDGCTGAKTHVLWLEVDASTGKISWTVHDSEQTLIGEGSYDPHNAGDSYEPGKVGLTVSEVVGQDTRFSEFRCVSADM